MATSMDRVGASVDGTPERGGSQARLVTSPPDLGEGDDDLPSPEAFVIGTDPGPAASEDGGSVGSRRSNTEMLLRELLDQANATIQELREQLGAAKAELKYTTSHKESRLGNRK